MRLYYIIGSQYERRKNTMEALTWLRKGWELAQNEKEQGFDYSIYSYIGSLIGWILMEEGSSLLAKDYIIESSRYIDKRNDSIMGLSLISMAYNFIEEYDSARLYANRTFEAIKKDSTNAFYIDRYKMEPNGNDKWILTVDATYHEDAAKGTDFRAVVDGYISVGRVQNLHTPQGK